jgi:hypothetical protein
VGFCLGLLFWSIGLPVCLCANTMLFLLLQLCSILWCFHHWTFCSESLGLFKVFCVSVCISWLIFLFLCRMSLEFW